MPLFTFILFVCIGVLFFVVGFLLWKRQRISLIHSYHYSRVRQEDYPAYTERMGKACLVMGLGCLLCGVLSYVCRIGWGFLAFGLFFLVGCLMMLSAQRQYNRYRSKP